MTKEMELAKRIYEAWGNLDAPTQKQLAVSAARTALGLDVGPDGRRDLIFEALCSAMGADWTDMPKHEVAKYRVAAKQLRELGTDPSEIIRRARRFETIHPDWELTATSLITHWSTLKSGGASTRVMDRIKDAAPALYVYEQGEVEAVGPPPEFTQMLRRGILTQMDDVAPPPPSAQPTEE